MSVYTLKEEFKSGMYSNPGRVLSDFNEYLRGQIRHCTVIDTIREIDSYSEIENMVSLLYPAHEYVCNLIWTHHHFESATIGQQEELVYHLNEVISTMALEFDEKATELEETETELNSLDAKYDNLKIEARKYEEYIEALETDIDNFKDEVAAFAAENDGLRKTISELEDELNHANSQSN